VLRHGRLLRALQLRLALVRRLRLRPERLPLPRLLRAHLSELRARPLDRSGHRRRFLLRLRYLRRLLLAAPVAHLFLLPQRLLQPLVFALQLHHRLHLCAQRLRLALLLLRCVARPGNLRARSLHNARALEVLGGERRVLRPQPLELLLGGDLCARDLHRRPVQPLGLRLLLHLFGLEPRERGAHARQLLLLCPFLALLRLALLLELGQRLGALLLARSPLRLLLAQLRQLSELLLLGLALRVPLRRQTRQLLCRRCCRAPQAVEVGLRRLALRTGLVQRTPLRRHRALAIAGLRRDLCSQLLQLRARALRLRRALCQLVPQLLQLALLLEPRLRLQRAQLLDLRQRRLLRPLALGLLRTEPRH